MPVSQTSWPRMTHALTRWSRLVTGRLLLDLFALRKEYSLGHLTRFEEYAAGPIQRDEALLLYAIVKTVDPKTIVEFGFLWGHSAINFLGAMSPSARLYSYDVSGASLRIADKLRDSRFRFILKSQVDFELSDVDERLIDLVFFDGSHDFKLNVETFARVKSCLNEKALIVVHDTGAWHGNLKGLQTPEGYFLGGTTGGGYIHRPDERRFVNHIRETTPDFDQIHLHSASRFRHGLTILQRNTNPLPL